MKMNIEKTKTMVINKKKITSQCENRIGWAGGRARQQFCALRRINNGKWQMRGGNPRKDQNCKKILHKNANGTDEP